MGRSVQSNRRRAKRQPKELLSGAAVSVNLTDLHGMSHYRGCHAHGVVVATRAADTVTVAMDSNLERLPLTLTVPRARVQRARDATHWSVRFIKGDRVQVLERNGWWDAEVVEGENLEHQCKVRWLYEYNHEDEEYVERKYMRRA